MNKVKKSPDYYSLNANFDNILREIFGSYRGSNELFCNQKLIDYLTMGYSDIIDNLIKFQLEEDKIQQIKKLIDPNFIIKYSYKDLPEYVINTTYHNYGNKNSKLFYNMSQT